MLLMKQKTDDKKYEWFYAKLPKYFSRTHIKVLVKGASSGQSNVDCWFVPQVSVEDALVDVFFSLIALPWDGVELLQDGDVIWLSVVEVDWQKWNSIRRKLVFKPGEGRHVGGRSNAWRVRKVFFKYTLTYFIDGKFGNMTRLVRFHLYNMNRRCT